MKINRYTDAIEIFSNIVNTLNHRLVGKSRSSSVVGDDEDH